VVLRALNKNQILILSSINGYNIGITALLQALSDRYNIPVSTLKLNARILERLDLVSFNGSPGRLTKLGILVLKLIDNRW
jgi:hypothetical protein